MSDAGRSLRNRKKQETARSLLDAGRELFQRQGFDETSVDQIAEQANVSRGTLFNYFPSKEALLIAVAREEVQSLRRMLETGLAHVPSAVARARRVMEILVNDTVPYLQITRQVLLQALLYPTSLPSPVREMEQILTQLAAEAQQLGEIRADLQPEEVARAVVGIYLAAFFAWIAEGRGGEDALGVQVEAMANMLFEGIAGPQYKSGC